MSHYSGQNPDRSGVRALAIALVMALLAPVLVPTVAYAEDPAEMTINKSASTDTVQPGETFEYTIVITCTNIGSGGCTSAELTDELPTGISLDPDADAITVTGADAIATETDTGFTVDFTDPLADPAGGEGMADGSTATITVPVVVAEDIDPELNGQDLVNTATADATNADPVSDTAPVTADIPINLAASTAKSFDPDSAIAVPGTETTMTLSGGNDSNVAVDEIVLTDPVDPPGAFEYLGLTGAPEVVLPDGAEQVQVDAYVDGNWINGPPGPPPAALPDGVDPADVDGLRIHFISTDGADIEPGATGTVDVPLEQRDNIEEAGVGPIPNEVSTIVSRDGDTSDPATADADYTLQSAEIDLAAAKQFDPDTIAAGSSSTVTIGATNTSDRTLETLTITEPGADPNMFTDGLTFDGWGDGVQWPAGATSASVTFDYADDTSETLDTDEVDTLPDPDPAKTVTGFTVEFSGEISPGAEATIPFTVTADVDQDADEVEHPNTIAADSTAAGGYHGEATADDTLTTIVRRIDIEADKRVVPEQIFSIPGQTALVELSGRITDFPDSTTSANDIVVQDPADLDGDAWYDSFEPTGVVETPIPADATLTVQYWNGDTWVDVPGMTDLPGPDTFSGTFPPEVVEDAQGIRFVYHSDGGFPPGTEVNPNIGFALRDSAAGADLEVEDCSGAQATSDQPDVDDAASGPVCDSIVLLPADPGNADFIDKAWDDPKAVGERTQEEAGLTIDWSTSGATNIDRMQVSDVPEPSAGNVDATVFDSFDLIRIDPITPELDPWLTYDQVTGVQLYSLSQDAWIDAPGDPCPEACDGTFPGYTLGADSRQDTIAFRLTFEESPTRADRIGDNPEAPPVGSGVARSAGNDRGIHPVFRIRDELRSDPTDPVLAEDVYNVDDSAGEVSNTARAAVIVDDTEYVHQDASDIIAITPVNVTADVTKDWTGGPLGVPEPGTADFPAEYPTGRVSLTAQNTTPAKVDRLTITEPAAGTDPFDVFNLRGFTQLTDPGSIGADDVVVTLQLAGGGSTAMTRDEALAATEAELTEVVGFTVVYSGRITAGATADAVFDTRLRPDHRGDGTPVTAAADSPVDDVATAEAADLLNYPGVEPRTNTDADPASIALEPRGIGIETTKDISPAEQTEPDDSPVTVTLTGQPSGPSRTNRMQLTDDDPTFFNAYDFVGFGDFGFTAPIDRVQVDAYVGGTFDTDGDDVVRTGGQWVDGEPGTALTLPVGVTADQVQGLRFTFTKADGSIWENPATPTQTVLLQMQRRADLRSGGPVLSDLPGNDPMPGEEEPGESSDDVLAQNWAADTVGGEPLTATAEATDTILYRHSLNAVEVTKSPTGAQPPAQNIPYTLTFTNTGDTPIVNPVITDHLPSDDDGPLLVKDPDLAPGESGYGYTLEGDPPDPPNGPPMPSDTAGTADQVQVEETPTLLTFTFPTGTVLEVGQTYTITTALQFRTGLPGDTEVTNTAGITADRPWDECEQELDESGECQAETTVYPTRAGALRGVKTVKADDDELGVLNTRNDPAGCTPNDAGFYAGGCVPVTKPGGTDTWRETFTNTGNLPQDKVYAIDRLPTPGDTGAITSLERGSQWTPTPQTITFVGATAGTASEIRVYYDTDQDLCTTDLDTLEGCPEGEWTPLVTVTDPQPGDSIDLPAEATAVKVETDFADDMLAPTGTLTLDLTTRAPAQSETEGTDTIAWNTVAAAAETDDSGSKGLAPKSEGNKVGVALATGPLQVVKEVEGPSADDAPAEFELTLQCVSVGEDVDLGPDASLTVTAGEPVEVDDIPWGSECTVTEDADAGATRFSATTVTVGRADDTVPVVVATNSYDDASLTLTKEIGDTALDQDGNPIPYGPFGFGVDCSFLGEPVFADGYGPDTPMDVIVESGETVTLTGLPAGSDCTATETDAAGASGTQWSLNGEPYVDGDTAELTLDPDGEGGTVTNTVDFTNDFPVTLLQIVKEVTGPGAERWGAGPFTVHLHCEEPDDGTVVYDADIVLGGDDPLSVTIEDLYDGATCEATETGTGGATTATVDPEGPFTVTGDDPEDPVTVTATNDFQVAPVRVTKQVTGDGAVQVPDGTEYVVQLTCTRDVDGESTPVPLPEDGIRTLTTPDDLEAVWSGLPVGATCDVAELDDGGATEAVITPEGPFTITATDPDDPEVPGVSVTVSNDYQVGAVQLIKEITGPAASQVADGTEFAVQLSCTTSYGGDPVPVPLPDDGVRTLTTPDQLQAAYVDIPIGSECVAVETEAAGAGSTVIDPAGPFIVGPEAADEPITVTATNDYPVAPVPVIKEITGDGAAQVPDGTQFTVQLSCTTEYGGNQVPVPLPDDGQIVLTTPDRLQAGVEVPVGAECVATEIGAGGAAESEVTPESVTVDPDGTTGFRVINTFDPQPTPTPEPTDEPTDQPTDEPTSEPTATQQPSEPPPPEPTAAPSQAGPIGDLPDTGGPGVGPLIIGLLLMIAGASVLLVSRIRRR